MGVLEHQENFVKQVPIDLGPKHPPGFYKTIILDVLTVASAVAFSFLYRAYLSGQFGLGLVGVSLVLFCLLSTLEVFFIHSLARRSLIVILEIIGLLFFFYDRPDSMLLIAGGVFLFFATLGEIDSRRLLGNSLELRFYKISRAKLGRLLTGLAVLIAIIYLPKVNIESLDIKNIFLNPRGFETIYSWSAGIVKRVYPEINVNSNLERLAKDIAVYRLAKVPEFETLTPADQQKSIDQVASDIIKEITSNIGPEVTSQTEANKLFYQLILVTLEKWKGAFGNWFLVAWIILFFLVVKALGVIVATITAGITSLIIQVFLGTGFAHIAGESRMKETLKF